MCGEQLLKRTTRCMVIRGVPVAGLHGLKNIVRNPFRTVWLPLCSFCGGVRKGFFPHSSCRSLRTWYRLGCSISPVHLGYPINNSAFSFLYPPFFFGFICNILSFILCPPWSTEHSSWRTWHGALIILMNNFCETRLINSVYQYSDGGTWTRCVVLYPAREIEELFTVTFIYSYWPYSCLMVWKGNREYETSPPSHSLPPFNIP